MNSKYILSNLFPMELQNILKNNNVSEVLIYFMSNNISDEKLAFYLSSLANQINTIEYHEMAASIYHFHFNYIDDAYTLAYYHYWQSLELSNFQDAVLLNEFLEMLDEPSFDIIHKEQIKIVANKILEKEPDNKRAVKYV